MTIDVEEKILSLEQKNIEYEEEIQCIKEDNISLNLKNNELQDAITRLNIRIKELNNLVYDFSRDKAQDEVVEMNRKLIRELDNIKSEKMMIEIELNKVKDILQKRKGRTSKPENKNRHNDPNSPYSFEFDGEGNEIFGDSFLIDSGNKELEEKINNLEDELKWAQNNIQNKNKEIIDLESKIEELEADLRNSEQKKSESFEMVNNDNIQHIKGVLLKFLRNVHMSDDGNESLLTVLFSMLHLSDKEITEIKDSRKKLTETKSQITKPKQEKKGGFLSRMLN